MDDERGTATPVLAVPYEEIGEIGEIAVRAQRAAAAVADLAIAGLYLPAGPGPEPVAGDFYEVLPLDGDRVALLVGDVAGHGPPALGRMRQLRAAARSCTLQQLGPVSLLAGLDRFMERSDEDAFATLWYGEYNPGTGALTYASAGHPPPGLHVHDGVMLLAEADAPPLGTGFVHGLASERTANLPPGAVLVAYSDGLVERRGANFDHQLALLTAVITRACDPARAGTPQSIATEVLDALVPDPDRAEDDVCLLVVRRQP